MSNFVEFPSLLTIAEAARVVGVTEEGLRRMIRRRQLRAVRLGRGPKARLRIERAELARFLVPTDLEAA